MSDLDPAHVEAVAGCLVSDHDRDHCLTHEDWSVPVEGGPCQTGREQAQKILTSTDPAVHAAMLAALVRAGVLTEEDHVDWCTQEEYHDDDHYWMRCGLPADHDGEHRNSDTGRHWERRPDIDPEDVPKPRERRYVTRWEDVDA